VLTTIVVILFILWLAGLVGGLAFGGLIHLLLVLALVIFVFDLLQRRRPPL
jgi:hypothetical protein